MNPVLDDATLALFEKKANEFLEAQEAWMDAQMKELMPESLYLRRNDPEAETTISSSSSGRIWPSSRISCGRCLKLNSRNNRVCNSSNSGR